MSPSFQGKQAEYLFASKAAAHGLVIGFPSIEGIPYDFFICNGVNTYRIQVKSTSVESVNGRNNSSYRVGLDRLSDKGGVRQGYTAECCDFIVVVLTHTSDVYIIPQSECPDAALRITPGGKYTDYKEAWHLLTKKIPRDNHI